MKHEEYKESVALDALGVLDRRERDMLEEHLRACLECRREQNEMRETAALLAYSVVSARPPEHLRERVLKNVSESFVTRKVEVASEVQTLSANGAHESACILRPQPERFANSERSRKARIVAFGALAASLVLAVSLFFIWREYRALRGEMARLNSEATNAREEIERQRVELSREREVAGLFSAPQSRVTPLQGTKDAPTASASLAFDAATGRAVLVASGLPPAPAGKAYQIWYIAGGKPLPGPTFKPDAEGRGEMRAEIPVEGREARQFAVTLESEKGAQAPSGVMYLLGSILNYTPSDANAKS